MKYTTLGLFFCDDDGCKKIVQFRQETRHNPDWSCFSFSLFFKADFSPVGPNSGAQSLGTADDRTGMPRDIVRDAENYKMP